jgi:hypothetical protein
LLGKGVGVEIGSFQGKEDLPRLEFSGVCLYGSVFEVEIVESIGHDAKIQELEIRNTIIQ